MTKLIISILITLFFVAIASSQPEIVENGQPSDTAKSGTITTSGDGIITINGYVSQISVKVKGDIIITAKSKDKIKISGDPIKPETLSDDEIMKYLSPAVANVNAKAAVKKAGYLIYHNVDGEVRLNDNRFILKISGKVEKMTVYGIGIAYFDGEGKYKVTKEGSTEVIEQDWQKTAAVEDNPKKKKKKQVILAVVYGDNTKQKPLKAKADPDVEPK